MHDWKTAQQPGLAHSGHSAVFQADSSYIVEDLFLSTIFSTTTTASVWMYTLWIPPNFVISEVV